MLHSPSPTIVRLPRCTLCQYTYMQIYNTIIKNKFLQFNNSNQILMFLSTHQPKECTIRLSWIPKECAIHLSRSPTQLARTLRCGSGTLFAQNGILHLRVLCPHVFFMLPGSIFRTVTGPLNLYHPYGFIPNHFDFPVQDVYWFHLEILFVLHLDHIPINDMIIIRYILFK
jgi:hypothetical protein